MSEDVILCSCHRQPVNTKIVKGKPFNKKEYYCPVDGIQLFNNFIYAKKKINLPDPDDTWDGSEVECPKDLEWAFRDYKKEAGGDKE